MRDQAQRLMKRRESAENNSTLVNIEKKLSNIEHRLSFIEEQNNEIQHKIRTNMRTEHLSEKEMISGASSESGIDKAEMDDGQYLVSDHEVEEIFSKQSDIQKRLGCKHDMDGCTISKIKIHKKSGKTKESADVHIWDILSHDKTAAGAETMIKLLKVYPNVHKRARQGWEKNEFDTANELTLGVPSKIRRKKMKSPQKHVKNPFSEREIVGSAIKPTCRFCRCQAGKNAQGKDDSLNFDLRRDQTIHSFPTRKPSNRLLAHPRVECECRQDPWANKGLSPFLTVTGKHVPLRDRDILYT
ncbi:uncharacterized protein LOC128243684 [Mya arenaria]|nr:uncharacterized protein LOC128243684 [Mya arenaria]